MNPLLAKLRKKRTDDLLEIESEESRSIFSKAKDATMSGLGIVGNALDIPGSMVRDSLAYLGGDSTANPFDQLMTPFSDENRIGGRELLRRNGMVGEEDTWSNWAGGLAAEIVLDPTTYVGGIGALSKAGKAAKATGLSGKKMLQAAAKKAGRNVGRWEGSMLTTLDDVAQEAGGDAAQRLAHYAKKNPGVRTDEALGGLTGYGIPFTGIEGAIGTGKTSQRIARGIDKLESVVSKAGVGSVRPVPFLKMLFNAPSGGHYGLNPDGTFNPHVQELAETAYDGIQNAKFKAAGSEIDASDLVQEAFSKFAGDLTGEARDEAFKHWDRVVRMTRETGDVNVAWQTVMEGAPATDDALAEISRVANHFQSVKDARFQEAVRLGMKVADLAPESDEFAHAPRYSWGEDQGGSIWNGREYKANSPHNKMRAVPIREIPAEIVNRMTKDEALRGKDALQHLLSNYDQYLHPHEVIDHATQGTRRLTPEEFGQQVLDWVQSHKPGDVFTGSNVADNTRYIKAMDRSIATLDAIHDYLGRNIADASSDGSTQTLRQAFDKIGMDSTAAAQELGRRLGKSAEDVLNMHVSNEAVGAATAILAKVQNPEWFSVAGKAWDSVNKVMKTWLTSPWPSFWTRNLAGGQAMNAMSGHIRTASDIKEYAASVNDVMGVAVGRKEAPVVIGADGNPIKLLNALHQYGVIASHGLDDAVLNVANNHPGIAAKVLPMNPFSVRESLARAAKDVDATGVKRLRKARIGLQAVAETGQAFNAHVEWANRAGMFLYLLRKGFDPAEAAREVKRLHVDYTAISDFERNVMKRLVPFYSFSRGITPVVAKTLATSPGGLMAQAVKHSSSDERSSITPDYIAETAAIPLGEQPDGSLRFLTGLGLPHEDTLSFAGGLRSSGLEALSRLNPLVKAPLEYFSNRSFFQKGPSGGRQLDDLDPTVGRLLANVVGQKEAVQTSPLLETVLANSPLSRALTTARTLTDERKGVGAKALNTLTGVRVTDVSPASQETVLREAVEDMLKQVPEARSYERTYVSKDAKATMAPDKRAIVERYESILKTLGERAKKRAAERKNAAQK